MTTTKLKVKNPQELIRAARRKGKYNKDVANCIGIAPAYYSSVINGKLCPGPNTAEKIADFFGKKIDDIFFEVSVKKNATQKEKVS
jgi:DNA-binding XRE family transcriptional regulator